jgi:hypothetical protein
VAKLKRGGGRPLTKDGAYARELGIRSTRVRELGGADKLRALSPEVRALLLGPTNYGSKGVRAGGLKARGMRSNVSKRNPTIYRSQAERVA